MAEKKTVYEHIAQNNLKTCILVFLFPLTWFCFSFFFFNIFFDSVFFAVTASTIAWLFVFALAVVSYFSSEKTIVKLAKATPLVKTENADVYNTVENTAIMAGLPMPKIYIMENDTLNAFAAGTSPQKSEIILTRGIINKLNKIELQGVVAHEMAHIGNRDVRLNTFIIAGIGVFRLLGEGALNAMSETEEDDFPNRKGHIPGFLFAGILLFLGYIWVPLIHLMLSRTREFAADATGAKIIHNPRALADALEKIDEANLVKSFYHQKTLAFACIVDPLWLEGWWATHPPVEERIKRLRNM